MKKIMFVAIMLLFTVWSGFSQKFAYVDSEYILNNIPAYKSAQDQLDKQSSEWQKEIENKYAEIDKLYKDFQSQSVLLSDDMKKKRENEIVNKEKAVKDLQKKYFGNNGDLFKKRQELVKPLQDEVYAKVKEIATEGNYAIIFDTAGGTNMLYTDPRYDKSDEVLQKLGYKN